MDDASRILEIKDEAATARLAAALAAQARGGDVIALSGPLGSGKTSFARSFIRARLKREEEVPSPSFTLVEIYEPDEGPAIWHFDLFRLEQPDEAWELGIEAAFASAISLIEWPERLGGLLPARRLGIELEFGDRPEARRAVLSIPAAWADRLGAVVDG